MEVLGLQCPVQQGGWLSGALTVAKCWLFTMKKGKGMAWSVHDIEREVIVASTVGPSVVGMVTEENILIRRKKPCMLWWYKVVVFQKSEK